MKRFLVCGGRDYLAEENIYETLDSVLSLEGPFVVVHGGATGADRIAEHWAGRRCLPSWRFPADWALHGKKAGPIRNALMLKVSNPDEVIAFPGGPGTADMKFKARESGVYVREVSP